jgi:flagellar motor switch protein FliN/FliY
MADPGEGGDAIEVGKPAAGEAPNLGFVLDVPLQLKVEIGHTRMLVRDVLKLGKGSVVELDRASGEPADVIVNDRLVARGEVTVIDDRVAVKIVEVVAAPNLGAQS